MSKTQDRARAVIAYRAARNILSKSDKDNFDRCNYRLHQNSTAFTLFYVIRLYLHCSFISSLRKLYIYTNSVIISESKVNNSRNSLISRTV